MNLYAYCLCEPPGVADLGQVVGMAGGQPRLIRCGAIDAVVSDFGGASVPLSREAVLEHERVVARVLAEATPLPFRFGTVVSGARLESYATSRAASLEAMFTRVRGRVEMNVKVIWDVDAIRSAAAQEQAKPAPPGHGRAAPAGPGTTFLEGKRRLLAGEEELERRAREVAGWLTDSLGHLAREGAVRLFPRQPLVLAAAHLVDRGSDAAYREQVRALAAERPDFRFLASGPWPPYSFTNL